MYFIVASYLTGAHRPCRGGVTGKRHLVPTRVHIASLAAPKGRDEALPEVPVHETVRDWVAARGHVRQKMDETFGHRRDLVLGAVAVEHDPRGDDVGGRPADEELEDDGEQHLDDASFGRTTLLAVGLSHGAAQFEPPQGPVRKRGCCDRVSGIGHKRPVSIVSLRNGGVVFTVVSVLLLFL